jgi:hypothetical protein
MKQIKPELRVFQYLALIEKYKKSPNPGYSVSIEILRRDMARHDMGGSKKIHGDQ